ncbi:lipopolysaccharide kinase InaA family protein [Azoarcus olearius]|uniref:Conserved hypothetical InaA protein n=1 Tax=Azoarcus sp. (strain BH72) TaxID=418699 RepID=A1KAC2_AZOSB|nr:lipopolysaccharide kinase InaA family protein [Azoarcus olearius]CAL95778.1 conserved hypothetical InaA protein [Azoarcus olearius]
MSGTLTTSYTYVAPTRSDFEAWWALPGEFVEPPNERRGGWSGVVRSQWQGEQCYVKRQRNHQCRGALHPFGWPTASREHFYLRRVKALGIAVPEVLYHGVRRDFGGIDAVLATKALTGFVPLSSIGRLDAATRRRLAIDLGDLLGRMHRARLQHGCLYDKHIMVRLNGGQPELALLDLEKMRYRITRRAAAERDLSQLRRHQQLWNDAEWRMLEEAHAARLARG